IILNDVSMDNSTGAAKVTVTNNQPKGSLTARSDGSVSGALKAGLAPAGGGGTILLDGQVLAPGATVTMTGDFLIMAQTSRINGSGNISGRGGGAVTLKASADMTLSGTISAKGADGADGAGGGSPGASGAKGGIVTLSALGDILRLNPSSPVNISATGGAG